MTNAQIAILSAIVGGAIGVIGVLYSTLLNYRLELKRARKRLAELEPEEGPDS